MTCIILKILVLPKITRILKRFLTSIIDFSQNIRMKSSRLKEYKNIEGNIIKDVRNFFRLKKLEKKKRMMPQLKI